MRKREIDKLLERAVAEALGVEVKPRGRRARVTELEAYRKARAEQHRAAA